MKILILGATGAAGGNLFDLALADARVTEVRTLSRRPIATNSSKHVGCLHTDLLDYSKVSATFAGLDAAFFCVGRAVALVENETEYRTIVRSYAEAAARELHARSPQAVFHYLSGQGASPTSRQMWARVKAEAEQSLIAQHGAICWKPGAIDATRTDGWPFFYKIIIPMLRVLAPSRKFYVKGEDLARAMLAKATTSERGLRIENWEIRRMADQSREMRVEG